MHNYFFYASFMSDLLDSPCKRNSAQHERRKKMEKSEKLPQVKTPKDLAAVLNLDEKSVRSTLRKITTEQPGSGGRWDLSGMPTEFWLAEFAKKKARKTVVAEIKG